MSENNSNSKRSFFKIMRLKIRLWIFKIKEYFNKDKEDIYDGLW